MSSDNNISNSDAAVDTTPLLGHQIFRTRPRFMRRPPSLRGASRFIRQASSRSRLMREPSVRVREAAAEQIEERHSDWAYSKPIVILDLFWNLAFVIVSITVMIMSRNESPSMPLRPWILGYDLQCIFHILCVLMEYKKRYSQRNLEESSRGSVRYSSNYSNSSSGSDDVESGDYASEGRQNDDETSVAKNLESANTMFSFIWWIIGFYWVTAGGQNLTHDSPQLYWFFQTYPSLMRPQYLYVFPLLCLLSIHGVLFYRLCITFLALDVFFVVICIAVACVIGIAVCCCLPCIIAILYAVADQEGATKEDIERLPKYKFRRSGDFNKESGEIQESFGGIMTECDTDSPVEHVLPLENVECCICLCAYDDGTELRELPCRHHFHSACIDKWLYMNATCPLCKFDILKNGNQIGREEV